jgi:dipeptidyl aminopeptidase/acylaminoacyl peptidase
MNNTDKLHDCIYPGNGVISLGKNKLFLQLPEGYDYREKYAFMLFFHGSGGSAADNNFTSSEFELFRQLCSQKQIIVMVPEYGSRCWFSREAEQIVLDIINNLSNVISIDERKFYVMGCSMGGAAALTFTGRYPDKVKAVCDVFGPSDLCRYYREGYYQEALIKSYGGSLQEIPKYYAERSGLNYIEVLSRKPLMIIHGTNDSAVPKWNSDIIVEKLRIHGADLTYIEVEGATHSNSIVKGLEKKILDFFESNYK